MKPGYCLLDSAVAELKDSATYYEGCSEGLGNDFLDAFEHAMRLIISFPEAWGALDENFRRFLMRRFPYGIIYRVDEGMIVVTSVFHLSRRPNSWRGNR